MKTQEAMTRYLAELINEWRRCTDAAEAAKELILDGMEAQGLQKAEASYEDAAGTHATTATYRRAGAPSLVLDSKRLEQELPDVYEAFRTKKRKGAAATVSFSRRTA